MDELKMFASKDKVLNRTSLEFFIEYPKPATFSSNPSNYRTIKQLMIYAFFEEGLTYKQA